VYAAQPIRCQGEDWHATFPLARSALYATHSHYTTFPLSDPYCSEANAALPLQLGEVKQPLWFGLATPIEEPPPPLKKVQQVLLAGANSVESGNMRLNSTCPATVIHASKEWKSSME
jgi:hypothetical protein